MSNKGLQKPPILKKKYLVHHPEKKHMPSPGFEPGSPQPQSKSDDLDRSAMGPAFHPYFYLFMFANIIYVSHLYKHIFLFANLNATFLMQRKLLWHLQLLDFIQLKLVG